MESLTLFDLKDQTGARQKNNLTTGPGLEKTGAAGLEPADLTDVNPKNGDRVVYAILLEVESFNN